VEGAGEVAYEGVGRCGNFKERKETAKSCTAANVKGAVVLH